MAEAEAPPLEVKLLVCGECTYGVEIPTPEYNWWAGQPATVRRYLKDPVTYVTMHKKECSRLAHPMGLFS